MKKLLLFLTVFSATLLTAQNIPSYIPTNGLVAWWPFNGNADDESGNNNNGIVYGPTLTSDRFNSPSSAYLFDGGTDLIATSTQQSSTNTYTVSFWTQVDSIYPAWLIVHGGNQAGAISYSFDNGVRMQIDGVFRQYVYNGSQNWGGTDTAVTGANQWYNIVFSLNSTGMKMYVNGSLSYHDPTVTTNQNLNGYWRIGGCTHPGHVSLFGKIDDIGIWNRTLDSLEIFNLFNTCSDSTTYQPQSNTFQTVPGKAHFVTSHSDTSATYQWQQNNGTGWTNLSDFGIYSGTTTDSLVLTGITTSLNSYGYRCIIDACTMDTTDVAYLTVVDNVGIDEDEATITIAPNPTSGILTIGLNSAAVYKVYNVNGQVVAKGKTDGQIDLTNLPSGSYQLILDSEEGSTVHSIQKI